MKKNDLRLIAIFVGALIAVNLLLVRMAWIPWNGRWDWQHFGIMVAAAMTVALFSQLYNDNPLFKMAESLFVGTSVGYTLVVSWYGVWVSDIFPAFTRERLREAGAGILSIIIPGLLGLMLYARLSKRFAWVSRIPFALMIGFGVGYSIPTTIYANLFKQLEPMMADVFHDPAGQFAIQWNQVLILIGVLTTLVYFFFSVEHKGAVGAVSRVGVWFLMVAFGASFGYTVMARLSLLIGRIDFLFRDWIPLIR